MRTTTGVMIRRIIFVSCFLFPELVIGSPWHQPENDWQANMGRRHINMAAVHRFWRKQQREMPATRVRPLHARKWSARLALVLLYRLHLSHSNVSTLGTTPFMHCYINGGRRLFAAWRTTLCYVDLTAACYSNVSGSILAHFLGVLIMLVAQFLTATLSPPMVLFNADHMLRETVIRHAKTYPVHRRWTAVTRASPHSVPA